VDGSDWAETGDYFERRVRGVLMRLERITVVNDICLVLKNMGLEAVMVRMSSDDKIRLLITYSSESDHGESHLMDDNSGASAALNPGDEVEAYCRMESSSLTRGRTVRIVVDIAYGAGLTSVERVEINALLSGISHDVVLKRLIPGH
jgi:hypothetical protein